MNSEKNWPTVMRWRKIRIEHQEQNGGAQRIHERALNKAQAAQVLHFLQFELQDFARRCVQAFDFLLREAEALHQFDVAQRFGGRACERGSLGDDGLLDRLDLAAEQGTHNRRAAEP